jgi:uncharacterized protein
VKPFERASAAVVAGAVFGVGLGISGMTRPTKVLAFLDVAGAWDPSLALVMAGAIGVHAIAVFVARRRGRTLSGGTLQWTEKTTIDAPLLAGAGLFGIGWGLGGFCPGPALASAGSGSIAAIVFVLAMLVGMLGRHATARMG